VDRLIALVALRWRLEARALAGARGRLAALLVALPFLLLMSLAGAALAFTAVRVAERAYPDLVLPGLSAVATLFGLGWALSPLLAGFAATETHDLGRLMGYPVPVRSLVASSLLANLLQPMTLAQLPPLGAIALALGGGGGGGRALVALAGLGLGFLLVLAAGQAVGLALHALSRNRRWHDRVLFLGLALGVALSLLPLVLIGGGAPALRRLALALLERDVFGLVPFSWGARAAVHAGRGEPLAFLAWSAAAALALLAVVGVSVVLAERLYRGELDVGEATTRAAARARLWLPGVAGALVEKDLRIAWRDPRLKLLVFTGVIGPLVLLLVLWQGSAGAPSPGLLLAVACFAGLGALGSNAFAFERQGLGLLFGFPADRFSILAAKNLGVLVLRVPSVLAVSLAALVLGGPALVPAVATVVLLVQVLAAAVDNYLSILFPLPVAAAGRDPSTPVSGTRALGTAVATFAAMLGTLLAAAPFVFLAWLPHLLGERWMWALTLPLALGGAVGVHFMATSAAARLLLRREPELVARLAGDE
jgi:ABC-2 type transport system permease protein